MILRKTLLAASAVALISTPPWALADQSPSDHGAKQHTPSTTPAEPPNTTPNNTDDPGASNRSQNGNHGGEEGASNNGSGQGDQGQGNDHGKPEHPRHQHPKHPSHPEHPGHPQHPGHPHHPGHPGNSHKCVPHEVGYIASGTLVSQTLSENPNGTYSGNVTVAVTRTNRHATSNEGMTTTYTLTDTRIRSDLADVNHDGSTGLNDLQAGDRVKLIGKITALAGRCSQSGFTATTTIRRIVFHSPPAG